MGLLDRCSEGGQIDFAQGALADDLVNVVALVFLIICVVVLNVGKRAGALNAFDVGGPFP